MQHKELSLETFDGLKLYAHCWLPDKDCAGVVNLVHGLGEHSGRYEKWGEWLTDQKLALFAFDLRGHGKSPGKRGVIRSYHFVLDDINRLLALSAEMFPGKPSFLYGHSMGGNFVLNFILHGMDPAINPEPALEGQKAGKSNSSFMPRGNNPENGFVFSYPLTGAIVTSPWIELSIDIPSYKIIFGNIARFFVPHLTLKNEIDLADLSHDTTIAERYQKDPLVHDKISVKLFFALYNKGKEILENAKNIHLPVLLMHGSADNITSARASKKLSESVPEKVTYKEWEGLYHELHNEPEKMDVFASIVSWMKKVPESINK